MSSKRKHQRNHHGEHHHKHQRGKTSLPDAFTYAWFGIMATFKEERNFRIELIIAVVALIAAVILSLEPLEWAVIILLITLVLALELANSALESVTDLVSPDTHPLAKYTKDAMAGAVLIAAFGAVVIGLVIYISAGLRLLGV